MKHPLTAALALQYGQEAAEKGLEFHPMYDTRFEELLTVATSDEERAANNELIKAWQTGYSEFCRSLSLGGLSTHEIILVDHTVLRGTPPTSGLVYWDWMDTLSVFAAFCEVETGHWSIFQEEAYLQRHWELQDEYGKISRIFRNSNEPCMVELRQLMSQEESYDLDGLPQPPNLVCEYDGLTDATRTKGLQYWSHIHSLSVAALHAEWKACNITLYQIQCYAERHPQKVAAFNKAYDEDQRRWNAE